MRGFVFGNGRSRLNIKFEEVKSYGKTYACNAVYREYTPDYLIAVDPKMIIEIVSTNYQLQHQVWTNPSSKYKDYKGLNYFEPSLGWSSGPTALQLATLHKPMEIYIFGFDFEGIEGKVNNVYAGTLNYKSGDQPATYHGNWQRQTEHIIKNNFSIKYYRVVERTYYNPGWEYPNFKNITYESLREIMGNWQKIA
jgi:hypothetical protein